MIKNNYSVLINGKYVEVKNIYAVGRNYKSHAKEMNASITKNPIFFQKSLTSLNTNHIIELPAERDIHYEVEVVMLIGTSGENINENDAFKYIEGVG